MKKGTGEIVSLNVISEKKPLQPKNFGIWLRYDSRSGIHNMYKEFRELSRVDAVHALYQDMAARHRARFRSVQILRVAEIEKTEDIRRPLVAALLRDSTLIRATDTSVNSSLRTSSSLSLTTDTRTTNLHSKLSVLPPSLKLWIKAVAVSLGKTLVNWLRIYLNEIGLQDECVCGAVFCENEIVLSMPFLYYLCFCIKVLG